jgi:hypothetical protein
MAFWGNAANVDPGKLAKVVAFSSFVTIMASGDGSASISRSEQRAVHMVGAWPQANG